MNLQSCVQSVSVILELKEEGRLHTKIYNKTKKQTTNKTMNIYWSLNSLTCKKSLCSGLVARDFVELSYLTEAWFTRTTQVQM